MDDMDKLDKVCENIKKIFDMFKWKWGIGSNEKIPSKNDIKKTILKLIDCAEFDSVGCSTGRILVNKDSNIEGLYSIYIGDWYVEKSS